jgi:nucleotide-binding universal stress UspA family protein
MTTHSVKKILAAMDNSQENSSLFKEALALASSMRAQVIVVSVTPEYEGNMNRFFLDDAEQQLKSPFQKVLAEASEYAASLGLHLETVHRTGKVVDEIIAVANEENVDLVLLGCRKRSQVGRMLLGRIIVEIIINGPCDVLLMPKDGEIRFDRLLVGIDGSPASAEAGRRACEVATSYGSEVHALYVTDIPLDRALRYGVTKEAEIKGWKILKDFVESGEKLDIPVVSAIRGNVPEECLVAYAKEKDIHLIVLGSQSDALGFDMFFGSIVERVASSAPCPVLVAKKRSR